MHEEPIAKRFYVSGLVQGVGYRYFAEHAAKRFKLAGYTRNLRDGRVEVYAIGPVESLAALDQINTSNVKNLVPVWSFSTGVDSGHESPPIVNNGVMFVSTPYSQVVALDAATGEFLWRYKRPLPEGFSALHNTSRGFDIDRDEAVAFSRHVWNPCSARAASRTPG